MDKVGTFRVLFSTAVEPSRDKAYARLTKFYTDRVVIFTDMAHHEDHEYWVFFVL